MIRLLRHKSRHLLQIQLYPKSLEPKNCPAKGQDFSLLTALEMSHPGAKTWRAQNGGTRFSAEAVSPTSLETSEPNPALLHELPDDNHSQNAPAG